MTSLKQMRSEYEFNKYFQLFSVDKSDCLPQKSPLRDTLDDLVELTIARTAVHGTYIVLTDGECLKPLAGGRTQNLDSAANGSPEIEFSWLQVTNDDWAILLWLVRQTIDDDVSKTALFDQTFHIPDLRTHERTSKLSLVSGASPSTFYAGAPLISPHGQKIGVVFVLDGAERTQYFESIANTLKTTAKRCMDALQLQRERGFHNRWADVTKDLENFIHSRSLRAPLLEAPLAHSEKPKARRSVDIAPDALDSSLAINAPALMTSQQSDTRESERLDAAEVERDRQFSHGNHENAGDTLKDELEVSEDQKEVEGEMAYKRVFTRAAKCLQHALQADGVMFVDGHVGLHGGVQPIAEPSVELEHEANTTSTEHGNHEKNRQNHRSYAGPEFQRGVRLKDPAQILGSFTRAAQPDTIPVSQRTNGLLEIDNGFLQRLMDRFRNGAIWYIHESKIVRVVDESLVDEDQADLQGCLPRTFPFARQLILQPLSDPTSSKRLAMCFIWKGDPKPVYSDRVDLPSLKAFLHVVESEIARYDAIAAVKQQGAFVSSVSHELRTPLHGILGAVQLLGDTELEPLQGSLVETITACGTTLHETLSSVLSYAQINQFERRQHKFRQSRAPDSEWALSSKHGFIAGPDRDYEGLYIGTNVAMLCEEIVGVLDAGQSFHRPNGGENLLVVLNIEHHNNWSYSTEPGALRRIAANLIGNALKYTQTGSVIVTLKAEQLISDESMADNDLTSDRTIDITVADTGKGISKDFLDNHLFAPFTQEDSTSSQGVGLGMSIVKSLVSLLSGQINIKSEVGVGSEFSVNIPMRHSHIDESEKDTPTAQLQTKSMEIRPRCLRIVIFGFPDIVRESLTLYLRDWYHCNLLEASNDAEPDIVVFDECNDSIRDRVEESALIYGQSAVLLSIVLNPKQLAEPMKTIKGFGKWERIPRPLGPYNVARSLLACMAKLDDKADTEGVEAESNPSQLGENDEASDNTIQSPAHGEYDTDPTKEFKIKEEISKILGKQPKQSSLPTRTKRPANNMTDEPMSDLNVLLVDDNALNLRLLGSFLKKNRYNKTQQAENGAQAVEAVRNHDERFDIIFMDLSMPVMNGFEATRQIRSMESDRKVLGPGTKTAVIVALTGLASTKDREDAFDAGVDMFLTKPVQFGELGRTLKRCEEGGIERRGTTEGD
ncbi:hypothetical protein B0J11DRAFT_541303 [Dendryphion nanum]|uniref:Histidine kinase n=1 Tax=Dendryphion nanum TaxID=256645 RepID=A0A9P9IBL4_9PLEO|nr:hypothetical protein B0J11DRAFT_541303 [Dendryphion nanum]